MRKYYPYPKRDPIKNYFPLPNELFRLGLSALLDERNVDPDYLKKLRVESVRNVRATNGRLTFEGKAREREEDEWQD